MLKYNTDGQDTTMVRRLVHQLESANAVSRGLLLPAVEPGAMESVARLLGFVPMCLKTLDAQGRQRAGLFHDDFQRRFAGRDSARMFLDQFDIPAVLNGRDPLNKSLFVWSRSMLPSYILNLLGDRMEMAHSIEGRVPFLDHRVVECVGRVPVSLKIRGLTEKYLLREAAKPVITPTVYKRQKHPFLSPPVANSPTENFHQLLQDTLRSPALASLPFYEQRKVVKMLDDLPGMTEGERTGLDPVLTSILSACVLQERFKMSNGG
jgi:asparagine synthase (glutamine-hydrolysing)